MNKEELTAHVLLAKNGNTDSFCKLYELYYKDMYRFAYYMLKDEEDAKDIISETVLDAFTGIKGLKNPEKFKAWIFRILTTKCKRQMAQYVDHKEHLTTHDEAMEIAAEDRDHSESIDLKNAFSVLNDMERTVLSLIVIAGYSSRETARMLKSREGTIRSIKSRALTKLSNELKEDLA